MPGSVEVFPLHQFRILKYVYGSQFGSASLAYFILHQEWCRFPEVCYEVFPGLPELRRGYLYANDKPGLGIDVDEAAAAKYPCQDSVETWTQTRLPDGSPARP